MKRMLSGTVGALAALACVLSATPASAQRWRDGDRSVRSDRREWNGHRDRHNRYQWNRYGRRYGYDGYRGRWREGQRYSNWNNRRYYLNDWQRYDLPPPRRGYRYYRDDNGDIVMAAIGSGIIGLILGSQMGNRW